MKEYISFHDARRIILDNLPSAAVETLPFDETLGRTLAEPVTSCDDIPPFDNSAMDGFAVRADDLADVPTRLRITGTIPAGTSPDRSIRPGTCMRIMTGAPVPEGADAVVPVEWTDADDREVLIKRAPADGQYIRRAGKDVRRGKRVFDSGEVVTPPVIGMLATLGYAEVKTYRPPHVAVLATGDELVDASDALQPGKIRNANGPALAGQVQRASGQPLPPMVVRDNEPDTRQALEKARTADLIVISGGVSVGEHDVVKSVLDDMGMELLFWKVRQKPGKPMVFGLLDGRPVFGLPGNPVSSAMCFEQHVRPALAKMLGRRPAVRPRLPAVLSEPVSKKAGRHYFSRGITNVDDEGRLRVRLAGEQASNLYTSVARANCTIHLPEDMEHPPAGTLVEIERLSW